MIENIETAAVQFRFGLIWFDFTIFNILMFVWFFYYFWKNRLKKVRWGTVIFAWLVRVWASKDTIRYRTIYTAVLIWFWIFWIFLLFLEKSLNFFWLGYCNCCLVHVWVSRDTTSLRTVFIFNLQAIGLIFTCSLKILSNFMHPFHEIFQLYEKKYCRNFFNIFFVFVCLSTFYYVKVRKSRRKHEILPSMCLEANGSIPGTCLAWALA